MLNKDNISKLSDITTIVFFATSYILFTRPGSLFYDLPLNFIFGFFFLFLGLYNLKFLDFLHRTEFSYNNINFGDFNAKRLISSFFILIIFFITELLLFDSSINENGIIVILFAISIAVLSYKPFDNNFWAKYIFLFFFQLFLFYPSIRFIDHIFFMDLLHIDIRNLSTFFVVTPVKYVIQLLSFNGILFDLPMVVINDNLHFRETNGNLLIVEVGYACTGIHSILIFFASFSSYFIQKTKNPIEIFMVCSLSFLIPYLSNLLRVSLLVLIGHFSGLDTLFFWHGHLGGIMFVIVTFLSWSIFLNNENKILRSNS